MTIIKKLVLLLSVFLLVSCQELPSIESDQPIYMTFELGVNYTDHMLAIAKNDQDYLDKYGVKGNLSDLYATLYTHEVHYLLPQILYYLPMDLNLDTKEQWEQYFNDWIVSLESGQYGPVKYYYENTIVKTYIENSFEYELSHLADIIKVVEPVYLEQFDYYKKNIWPELAEILFRKCAYINESLASMDLQEQWRNFYNVSAPMIYSISNYHNKDMTIIRISDAKTVLSTDLEEPIEVIEEISYNYGLMLAIKNDKATVKEFREAYGFLNKILTLDDIIFKQLEFAVSQMNNAIMGIETREFVEYVRKGMYPIKDVYETDFVKHVIEAVLLDQKISHPFIIDGKLNYLDQVYEVVHLNDELSVYYKQSFPLVIEHNDSLQILENTFASIPTVSPDKEKLLFISPYEWEVIGALYTYELDTGFIDQLIDADYATQETIKRAIWYDLDTVYFIKGYAYGTVSRGGSVYKMNLITRVIEHIPLELDEYSEVSHIEIKDNRLKLTIVVHNEDATDYEIVYQEIDIVD